MPAPSPFAVAAAVVLSALALLIWAVALATLADLAGSDAAGNGLAQAYAAVEIVTLWLLLAGLAILAAVKGAFTNPARLAALILIPASAVAALIALGLLSEPKTVPYLWPIIIPVLVPPLIVSFCFRVLLPKLHAAVSAPRATAVVWGATFILCAAIVPMALLRLQADDRKTAHQEK
jgi:hypothetical protein